MIVITTVQVLRGFVNPQAAKVVSTNVCKTWAGAAAADITPAFPVFLYGYPHARRTSTGVHDALFATALFLDDGRKQLLLISVDVIWLSKEQVARTRRCIHNCTGVPAHHILISATHTHSGPVTVEMLSNALDPVVPAPDQRVMEIVEKGIIAAASRAKEDAIACEIGFSIAKVSDLGGNRHDPQGLSIPQVSIFAVRATENKKMLALLYVFNVHPTVLHEDSLLISGDFPGLARRYLQARYCNDRSELPVLGHLGAAGDQSPRNVVRGNTLEEAERLGKALGRAVEGAVGGMEFRSDCELGCGTVSVNLPLRKLPAADEAAKTLRENRAALAALRAANVPRAVARTAECDCFGAEEMEALVTAAASGKLEKVANTCLPAEIQYISVGPHVLVGWPGEIFAEFAIQLRDEFPSATLITLANGELQGYLTTSEAVEKGWYEASNAIFSSPESPCLLFEATVQLLREMACRNEVFGHRKGGNPWLMPIK